MKADLYLRSKVARRVAGLFLTSAIVPVVILAALTLSRVTQDLESQARQRLDRQSRSVGVMVLDRLAAATEAVGWAATEVIAGRAPNGDWLATNGIEWIATAGSTGVWHPLTESAVGPIVTGERSLRRIRAGRPWLELTARGDVVIARHIPGDTTTVFFAGIAPVRLWGADAVNPLNPDGTSLCIRDARMTPLHERPSGACTAATDVVAGSWTAFLGYEFGSPSWQVFLTEPKDRVYAPIAGFWSSYLWVGILTLAIVFVLANVQIRRSMEPLDALAVGTKRLAAGDLSHRVAITSQDEFGGLAESFNGMAGSLEQHLGLLTSLQGINHAALATPTAAVVRQAALAALDSLFPSGNATIALASDRTPDWGLFRTATGSEPLVRRLDRSGRAEVDAHATAEPRVLDAGSPLVQQFGLGDRIQHATVPLRREGELFGILIVTSSLPFGEDDLRRLAAVGTQASMALANAVLVGRLDEMSWGSLKALARTIDANSPWTAGHSERVTAIALRIAAQMRLSDQDQDLMHRGGLLHDIGKIGVPATIIDKPGKLTLEEREIIQRHPEIGANILGPVPVFDRIIPLVRWHHEALDGSGYPDRLRGDQIPLNVRILTVADVFEALTADRPYRQGWTVEDSLGLLVRESGTKFDATVVAAWEQVLSSGVGLASLVQLPPTRLDPVRIAGQV